MKRLFLVAALLFFAVGTRAQTSNSLPFTAVTPPAPPVLTSLGGLSASGKIYTGSVIAINGTGFSSGCVVNVDGTAQAASTFSFVSSTLINFTVPTSLGSSSGTSHTLTVSCAAPVLTMNDPGTLPNGKVGTAYSASLMAGTGLSGGLTPYTWTISSGSLPTGLTLSPSGSITGTPSSAGSFTFGYTVSDSSGLALRKELKKEVKSVSVVIAAK